MVLAARCSLVAHAQEIYAESSNEFINKARQKISKIPDYDLTKFDVYGRASKGSFVHVKRTSSSHYSVCDRIHESDDILLLIFNEKTQCAWWKCTLAFKKTLAIRWYGRGKLRSQLMRMRARQKTFNHSLLSLRKYLNPMRNENILKLSG